MLWRDLKEQTNMIKRVVCYNLKFNMGIGIQNLQATHTFTLRWIMEDFLRFLNLEKTRVVFQKVHESDLKWWGSYD